MKQHLFGKQVMLHLLDKVNGVYVLELLEHGNNSRFKLVKE